MNLIHKKGKLVPIFCELSFTPWRHIYGTVVVQLQYSYPGSRRKCLISFTSKSFHPGELISNIHLTGLRVSPSPDLNAGEKTKYLSPSAEWIQFPLLSSLKPCHNSVASMFQNLHINTHKLSHRVRQFITTIHMITISKVLLAVLLMETYPTPCITAKYICTLYSQLNDSSE